MTFYVQLQQVYVYMNQDEQPVCVSVLRLTQVHVSVKVMRLVRVEDREDGCPLEVLDHSDSLSLHVVWCSQLCDDEVYPMVCTLGILTVWWVGGLGQRQSTSGGARQWLWVCLQEMGWEYHQWDSDNLGVCTEKQVLKVINLSNYNKAVKLLFVFYESSLLY